MRTLCWSEGGRECDLLCLGAVEGWWEGVDLLELLSSLSTVQAVTVTNPAPRASPGESSLSLTLPDSEERFKSFVKTLLIIPITGGQQLVQRHHSTAEGGLGHGESLSHILNTDPHLGTMLVSPLKRLLTTHLSLSGNVVLGSECDS